MFYLHDDSLDDKTVRHTNISGGDDRFVWFGLENTFLVKIQQGRLVNKDIQACLGRTEVASEPLTHDQISG